jgi:hypothetical protein
MRRVDIEYKGFNFADCDAAGYLSKLKFGGKLPATLFLGLKTSSGKTWQGESLLSELSTLRKQAVTLEPDGEVEFHELAREISRHRQP